MQNVMHSAKNAGHTRQNDGQTMQNDGCNTLNVCQGPKGELEDHQRINTRVLCALYVLLTQILFKWFKPLKILAIFKFLIIFDNSELGKGMETSQICFNNFKTR